METIYHVNFKDENGTLIEARMYTDEEGSWKFAAQTLPLWVFSMEIPLGDAIDDKNA